jgi:uncharacterized protein YjiS (DUF1127 family)
MSGQFRKLRLRRAAMELFELDDERLSDIGISRGMIDYYVANGREL